MSFLKWKNILNKYLYLPPNMVDVAQLVRASVCGTEGRGFESRLPPKFSEFFMGWFSSSSTKFNWSLLSDDNTLKDLIKLSFSKKVLIFKHSTRCSISNMSKNRLENIGEDSKIKNCFINFCNTLRISMT